MAASRTFRCSPAPTCPGGSRSTLPTNPRRSCLVPSAVLGASCAAGPALSPPAPSPPLRRCAAGDRSTPPPSPDSLAHRRTRQLRGARRRRRGHPQSPSKTFYVAAAGGGIWKTTNAGTTFRPVFDDQRVISMGALAIAPVGHEHVWAGTGEQNSRNTIEPGGGIFKSTDGGHDVEARWGSRRRSTSGASSSHPHEPEHRLRRGARRGVEAEPERGLYKTDRRRHDLEADQVRRATRPASSTSRSIRRTRTSSRPSS